MFAPAPRVTQPSSRTRPCLQVPQTLPAVTHQLCGGDLTLGCPPGRLPVFLGSGFPLSGAKGLSLTQRFRRKAYGRVFSQECLARVQDLHLGLRMEKSQLALGVY